MQDRRPLEVLSIGQSLDSHGGVANQQRRIIAHLPPTVRIDHVSTTLARVGVGRFSNFIRFAGAWITVARRLLSQRPDVIHMYISQRGSVWRKILIIPLARARRVPVILHSQGSEFHLFFRGLPRPMRSLVTLAMRRCDRVIVLAESWKRFFVDEVGLDDDRVVVIPNSADLPQTVPDRRGRSTLQIVFLGRIGCRKGTFELIEAFASLPDATRSRARLRLCGDGETARAVKLAHELGCSDRVEVPGWLDDDLRDAVLKEADIFVLPTHNEGLPLALVEAMSWGLPCISTPVGGIPEILEDQQNGLMAEPGNVKQLRDQLCRLIDDEPFRLGLGVAARKTAERLDTRIQVKHLKDLYEHLAGCAVARGMSGPNERGV